MLPDEAEPPSADEDAGRAAMIGLSGRLGQGLSLYGRRVRLFRPNARLYLLFTVLAGAGFGPVFLGTAANYVPAIFLYWRFFWAAPLTAEPMPAAARVK